MLMGKQGAAALIALRWFQSPSKWSSLRIETLTVLFSTHSIKCIYSPRATKSTVTMESMAVGLMHSFTRQSVYYTSDLLGVACNDGPVSKVTKQLQEKKLRKGYCTNVHAQELWPPACHIMLVPTRRRENAYVQTIPAFTDRAARFHKWKHRTPK